MEKKLEPATLSCIFQLTECHPYYINKLCRLLWVGKLPTVGVTIDTWRQYALENQSFIERELELLSVNQRRILCMLAKNDAPIKVFGKEAIADMRMSASSIAAALKFLQEKDYVMTRESGTYRILDPLIKTILSSR